MNSITAILLDFNLPDNEAQALAQAECYEIHAAIGKLQRALADAGYAPR